MQLDNLNKWLTLLANLGVVAGIVFLSLEIQQNQLVIEESNKLSRLQARTTEIQMFNDWRTLAAGDAELSRIWLAGMSGKELAAEEEFRFFSLCMNNIWTSVGTYERSIELGRPEVARGTAATRAQMIRDNAGFARCWELAKESVRLYGLSEYIDSVEGML